MSNAETIISIANTIFMQCGRCPKRILVPEELWASLYMEILEMKDTHKNEKTSWYKIKINTPFGLVEVVPE